MGQSKPDKVLIPNNIIRIPCKLDGRFFKYWCDFLQPLHHLTEREKEVIACFIKYRYELSKSITDETILNKYLMSSDIQNKIKKECNLNSSYLKVVLTKFRKNKIIDLSGAIHPKLIPHIDDSEGSVRLMVYFDFNE